MNRLTKQREVEVKEIVKKIYLAWKNRGVESLAGTSDETTVKRGDKAEKKVIGLLRKKLKEKGWFFEPTYKSRTPVDIIGFRTFRGRMYCLLIQVKSGKYKNLFSRKEINNFPELRNIVKKTLENEDIDITTCYFLVPKITKHKRKIYFDSVDKKNSTTSKSLGDVAEQMNDEIKSELKNNDKK